MNECSRKLMEGRACATLELLSGCVGAWVEGARKLLVYATDGG